MQEKKKPGRPKKPQALLNLNNRGIVPAPENPDNLIEVGYQNPKLFKKIFALLKAYNTDDVYFQFEANCMTISAISHNNLVNIECKIDCSKMHYYCAEPRLIVIKRNKIEDLFPNIDKSQSKITIFYAQSIPNALNILIYNFEMQNTTSHSIEFEQNAVLPVVPAVLPPQFEWCFAAKFLKNKISAIAKVVSTSGKFNIEKLSHESPLTIKYMQQTAGRTMDDNYSNPEVIQLVIHGDAILDQSVEIRNIKPFSNCILGDVVKFAAAANSPLVMETLLDKINDEGMFGGSICKVRLVIS